MLKRVRGVAGRLLTRLASLPLRTISHDRRRRILQELSSEMVVDVPVRDGVLRFAASSPSLWWRANGALEKEPDTIQWIDGFQPGDVLWDVGANVGVFSLYAAKRPGIRVLAFEPMAENYAALCVNIFESSLSERVVPYCIAFAGTTALGVLNLAAREAGTSLHQFGKSGERSRYFKDSVSDVQGMIGYTIDDFIAQFTPPFPTHLKLDVDGLEWSILRGAPKTLRDSRLRSIMVELNLNDEKELDRATALLSDAGLACSMRGQVFVLNGETAMNHFFVRN
jgi:FkbM family methyltransferase